MQTAAEIASAGLDERELERAILRHMEHHMARAAAAEREACAKLLERDAAKRLEASAYYDDLRQAEKHELAASSLDEAAAAIRARSTPDATR